MSTKQNEALDVQHSKKPSAMGKGYPLRITAVTEVRVDDDNVQSSLDADQKIAFVRGVLPTLDWSALVKVCQHVVVTNCE